MKNNKLVFGIITTVVAFGVVSCSDEGTGPTPKSVKTVPSSLQVVFESNEEATISFDKATSNQSQFNIRFTDQYGEETEYEDVGESPVEITGFAKGEIYTVEIAGGTDAGVGEYGNKTEAMLASMHSDKNNMIRIDMLNAINEARAEARMCGDDQMAAVPPLNWDDKLEMAAEIHTVDMQTNNFFDHTSASNGSTMSTRIADQRYTFSYAGENIHRGSSTAQAAVASWLTSPGHCRNIMSPNFQEVGSANAGAYWTQVFGTSR